MSAVLDRPSRKVRLFRNGRNQALRIPKEFEFSTSQASISPMNGGIFIEPVIETQYPKGSIQGLLAVLATMEPITDEEFPDVDEGLLPLVDDIIL